MPELPEVEVVRAGLERHVVGSTIEAVEVLYPRGLPAWAYLWQDGALTVTTDRTDPFAARIFKIRRRGTDKDCA